MPNKMLCIIKKSPFFILPSVNKTCIKCMKNRGQQFTAEGTLSCPKHTLTFWLTLQLPIHSTPSTKKALLQLPHSSKNFFCLLSISLWLMCTRLHSIPKWNWQTPPFSVLLVIIIKQPRGKIMSIYLVASASFTKTLPCCYFNVYIFLHYILLFDN